MKRLNRKSSLWPALAVAALLLTLTGSSFALPWLALAQGGSPPLGITVVPGQIRVGEIVNIQVDGDRSPTGGLISISSSNSAALSIASGCNNPQQGITVRVLGSVNLVGCAEANNVVLTLRQGSRTHTERVNVVAPEPTPTPPPSQVCVPVQMTATSTDSGVDVSWRTALEGTQCIRPERWELAAQHDGQAVETLLSRITVMPAGGQHSVSLARSSAQLETGSDYTFQVRGVARNGLEIGAYAHSSRVRTAGRPPASAGAFGGGDAYVPPPRNVTAVDSVGNGTIRLMWRPPATPEGVSAQDAPAYKYDVKLWGETSRAWTPAVSAGGVSSNDIEQGSESCTPIRTDLLSYSDCTSFDITGLTHGKLYFLQVSSVDPDLGHSELQTIEAAASGEPGYGALSVADQKPIDLQQVRANEAGTEVLAQWRYPEEFTGVYFQLQVGFDFPEVQEDVLYVEPLGGGDIDLTTPRLACWSASDTLPVDRSSRDADGNNDCMRFLITGLSPNSTYPIRARAVSNSADRSEFSHASIQTRGAVAVDALFAVKNVRPHEVQPVRVAEDGALIQWRYDERFEGTHFQVRVADRNSQTPAQEHLVVKSDERCWTVDRNKAINTPPAETEYAPEPRNCTRFAIEGLDPGSSYSVSVNAINPQEADPEDQAGNPSYLDITTSGARANVPDVAETLPPRNLKQSLSADPTTVTLQWRKPGSTLTVAYYMARYRDYWPDTQEYVWVAATIGQGEERIAPGAVSCNPTSRQDVGDRECTVFQISNLLPYFDYNVEVYAHYEGGGVSAPARITVRTDPNQYGRNSRIPPPVNLYAVANAPGADRNTLTVQWESPDVGDLQLTPNVYLLEYATELIGSFPVSGAVFSRPSEIEETDRKNEGCGAGAAQCYVFPITGLDANNSYRVRVFSGRRSDGTDNNLNSKSALFAEGVFRIGQDTSPALLPQPASVHAFDVRAMDGGASNFQATIQWQPPEGVIENITRYEMVTTWFVVNNNDPTAGGEIRDVKRQFWTTEELSPAVACRRAASETDSQCFTRTVIDLVPGESYDISVRAYRDNTAGEYRSTIVKPVANVATRDLPGRVRFLEASESPPSFNSIELSWPPSPDIDLSQPGQSYLVQWCFAETVEDFRDGRLSARQVCAGDRENLWVDIGVAPGSDRPLLTPPDSNACPSPNQEGGNGGNAQSCPFQSEEVEAVESPGDFVVTVSVDVSNFQQDREHYFRVWAERDDVLSARPSIVAGAEGRADRSCSITLSGPGGPEGRQALEPNGAATINAVRVGATGDPEYLIRYANQIQSSDGENGYLRITATTPGAPVTDPDTMVTTVRDRIAVQALQNTPTTPTQLPVVITAAVDCAAPREGYRVYSAYEIYIPTIPTETTQPSTGGATELGLVEITVRPVDYTTVTDRNNPQRNLANPSFEPDQYRAYRIKARHVSGGIREVFPMRIESSGPSIQIAAARHTGGTATSHAECERDISDGDYSLLISNLQPESIANRNRSYICMRALPLMDDKADSIIEFYQIAGTREQGAGQLLLDMVVETEDSDPTFTEHFTVSPLNRSFVRGVRYRVAIRLDADWDIDDPTDITVQATIPDPPAMLDVADVVQLETFSHNAMGAPISDPTDCDSSAGPDSPGASTLSANDEITIQSPASNREVTFCLQAQNPPAAMAELRELREFSLSVSATPNSGSVVTKNFHNLGIVNSLSRGAATITRGDDILCTEDEALCLRPVLDQICAQMGFSCQSMLFLHLLLLGVCFALSLTPLIVSLRAVGVITVPYFALSFALLVLTLSIANRVAGLPAYYAVTVLVIVLTLGILGMSGRLGRLAS